jgi:hypothetical protein
MIMIAIYLSEELQHFHLCDVVVSLSIKLKETEAILMCVRRFETFPTPFVLQQKPSFELSGKLAEETNKVAGA